MQTVSLVHDLKHREFWTPSQAASVLGRSHTWWADAFDAGRVRGYSDGPRRHLEAASARAHLQTLVEERMSAFPESSQPTSDFKENSNLRTAIKKWRDEQLQLPTD